MRKKIQDLIKGKYEYTRPKLVTEQKVAFEVLENQSFAGSFSIASENQEKIRGIITCSHPYMECVTKQFDDTSVEVQFEYHAVNIEAGKRDKGTFVIACSSGEYVIPFEASITRFYHESSIGKIKSVNDFSNLAKLNWAEALTIFKSKFFPDILDSKTKLLYKGLCYRGAAAHEMEEFLVGIGKKSRIQFSVDNPDRNHGRIQENLKETVRVFKSGWGHLDIHIKSDVDFIHLDNDCIKTSDFEGRATEICYTILADRLHTGKNYGTVILFTPFQKQEISICVHKSGTARLDARESAKKFHLKTYALLIKKYIDYKLGHFPDSVWYRESMELFDKMIERDPSERMNFLLKCHLLLIQGKKEDAAWILEDAAYGCKDKHSPEWCYIQYLHQMLQPKEAKRQVILADIKAVFAKHPDHAILFFLLLDLDSALQENKHRYAVIKKYLAEVSCSPMVYYEAYALLKEEPSLAKEMDDVDIRICYWIAKQNLLDTELINMIMEASVKVRIFHERFFWLLGRCYKQTRDEAGIRIICTYLIQNNKYGENYLNWFARGLENKMRIGGICEAYMQSWRRTDGDIPEVVLKYFSKRNLLPAVYKCRLYAYVVRNKERLSELMDAYRTYIIPFLEEELKKNHMNDELAEICKYVKKLVSPEAWRDMNQGCTNVQKIIGTNSYFNSVAVYQQGMDSGQKAALIQNVSYVHLYSDEYQVLFEDAYGYRFFVKDGYRVNKMFPKEWKTVRAGSVQMEEISSLEETNDMLYELEELSGSMESLNQRIQEAQAEGVDVTQYQEQLLVRMLFTETFTENHVSYFREICKHGDTTQLRDAYVSWFSWRYLCWQEKIAEEVFEYLEYSVTGMRSLNRCCELAFFAYMCQHGVKKELESWFLKQFEQLLEQGMKLPCFEFLPEEWKRAYFIHDCSYLTYTGETGKKLACRLKINSGGKRFMMNHPVFEVAAGYYVLAVRLFADEIIDYEFIENDENVLSSGSVKLSRSFLKGLEPSKYQLLNEVLRDNQMQYDRMQKYAEMLDMVNCLFQPL